MFYKKNLNFWSVRSFGKTKKPEHFRKLILNFFNSYYQYYRLRTAPRVDVRIVIGVAILLISIIQV